MHPIISAAVATDRHNQLLRRAEAAQLARRVRDHDGKLSGGGRRRGRPRLYLALALAREPRNPT